MRALRATLYPPGSPPVTMVMRACDLAVPIEDAAQRVRDGQEHVWIVTEIFTLPDETSIEAATLLAHHRQEHAARREMDMAIAFYWYTATLQRVRPGGVVTATRPAPLAVEALLLVAQAVARHPLYDNHTLFQIAEDGRRVVLAAGETRVLE